MSQVEDSPNAAGPEFVESLARGLKVLAAFTPTNSAMGLSELARVTGLGKRTTYRLARTLEALGYLTQDPRSKLYRPSLRVLDLGYTVLESMELRQRAHAHLDALCRQTGEFVSLAVRDGRDIVMIDTFKPQGITVGVQRYLGSREPAHMSSHGKVLFAWLPQDELVAAYPSKHLEAHTPFSITTRDAFVAELEGVRSRGFAINDQESSIGVLSVAAPIRDRAGTVTASVNLAVPTPRADLNRLVEEYLDPVVRCAMEVSEGLGYRS